MSHSWALSHQRRRSSSRKGAPGPITEPDIAGKHANNWRRLIGSGQTRGKHSVGGMEAQENIYST